MAVQSVFQTPRACLSCGSDFIPEKPKGYTQHYRVTEFCSEACRLIGRRRLLMSVVRRTVAAQLVRPVVHKAANPRPLPEPKTTRIAAYPTVTLTGKQRWNDESRWRLGAKHLGLTLEQYRDHVLADEKWCSRCHRWQPIGEFGPHKRYGIDTVCLESSRAAAREYQRRKRARILEDA